jgi:hypothetical protein
VIDVLSDLFILRGVPAHIRSDNGPEFVAKAVQEWIAAVGAKTAYIERGVCLMVIALSAARRARVPGELPFIISGSWCIAAIAHCFECLIDLTKRSLGHGGVPLPLSKKRVDEGGGPIRAARAHGSVPSAARDSAAIASLTHVRECVPSHFQPCCSALAGF